MQYHVGTLECWEAGNLHSIEKHLSPVGFCDPGDDIEHSRLARTVWPDDAQCFPFVEMHAEVVTRPHGAVTLRDAI